MSNASGDTKDGNEAPKAGEQKDDFVAKSAYEEVSRDMHKYKSTNKELTARLNELETQIKTSTETKMQEEKRYEELYQNERANREKAENALKNTNEHYIKSVKMTALMRELGGTIKPKYLQHADLEAIEVRDDGTLSSESLTAVANKFRQENPELVPSASAGNINDAAPGSTTVVSTNKNNLEELSKEELRSLLASKRASGSDMPGPRN